MRRDYDDDPLAFVVSLMKRFGEAGGRKAFLKFVAENDPEMTEQAPALADFAARVFSGESEYDPEGSARPERKTDKQSNVIRLDDAKALRAMGLPLSTQVVDREFPPRATKKITAVLKATRAFGNAVQPWAQKQTSKRYAAAIRTWEKLERALARAAEREDEEAESLVAGFTEPCRLVCEQWDSIFTALENGKQVHIAGPEGAPWPLGPFPQNPGADSPRPPDDPAA
jgi:hypothetical protein